MLYSHLLNFIDPSQNFENTRRKIFEDSKDLSYYVNSQINSVIKTLKPDDLKRMQENLNHRIK